MIHTAPMLVNLGSLAWDFHAARPFPFCVIDGFWEDDFARELAREFPAFCRDDPLWNEYRSPLEDKLTTNRWDRFGPATYRAFSFLNSAHFVELLRLTLGMDAPLYADPGLHGGGLHAHGAGGKLNVHLDYEIHPKLKLQRKLNLLVYLSPDWNEAWGGSLGLWEPSPVQLGPGALAHTIAPKFNRAVLFDTTRQSWHGLPEPITCPPGQVRQSMAVYYLTDAVSCENARTRALFAPSPEQAGDAQVLQLIERRASEKSAELAYRVG